MCRTGLSSVLASKCTRCLEVHKMHTSEMVNLQGKNHYSSNIRAVLGQVATGGGGAHLEEQLMSMDIPALSQCSFINLERSLGLAFESIYSYLLAKQKGKMQLPATRHLKAYQHAQ